MSGPLVVGAGDGAIERAQEVLNASGLVLFPTETYYGIAARPDRSEALGRLTSLKSRGDSLPTIAADVDEAHLWVDLPPTLARLAEEFWPGPLTLVAKPKREVDPAILGGRDTVAIRVPGHTLARRLAKAGGGVITSTSANPRGQLPPNHPSGIATSVLAAVDLVIDGGTTPGEAPSTLVGWADGQLHVYRAGAIGVRALELTLNRARS